MSFVPENVVEMYDGNQIGVPENVTQNLAPIEVTGTATRAYAVGDYMVFGGLLRKVTQAIAQGGTITVGTNVESTKVSTELQGISSDLSEFDGDQIVTLKLRETINIQASQTIFTSLAGLLADNDFIMQDVMVTRHSGTLTSFPVGFTGTASPYASLSGYIGNSGYVLSMSSSGVIATGTEVNVCGTFKYIPKR